VTAWEANNWTSHCDIWIKIKCNNTKHIYENNNYNNWNDVILIAIKSL
jgi:hypothetical protein